MTAGIKSSTRERLNRKRTNVTFEYQILTVEKKKTVGYIGLMQISIGQVKIQATAVVREIEMKTETLIM